MRPRRFAVFAGTMLAAACWAVAAAAPASAHADAAGSIPADGSTVDTAPGVLDLRFTEQVELGAAKVSLVDSSGRILGTGKPELLRAAGARREDPVTVRVPLPVLPADTYRVSWNAVSSDDLHATTGTLVFGVRRAVAPAAAAVPADPLPGAPEVIAQASIYLGLGCWIGAMTLLALLRAGDAGESLLASTRSRLLKAAAACAGIGFLGGIAPLMIRAAVFDGALVHTAWLLVSGSSIGPPWLAREAAAAAMAGIAVFALRGRPSPAVVTIGAALTAAVSTTLLGHLSTSGPLLVLTDSVHVLATMLWAGSVIAAGTVLLSARGAGNRVPARAVLRRFGLIATSAVTVLAATGLLLAGNRVASVDALLLSTYGRLLLVKIALVAIAGSIGLFTTLRLHGRRAKGGTSRLVRAEMAVLAAVLVMTAGLVSTHQAVGPQWRHDTQAGQTSASATAGDLVETVSVRPNLPGRNFVAIAVFDTRRPSPGPVQSIVIGLTGPGGKTVTRTAVPTAENSYLLTTDDFDASGAWQVDVTALRPQLAPVTGSLTWSVSPSAIVTREAVVSQSPLTPFLWWLAGAVLCIGLGAMTVVVRRVRRPSPGGQRPAPVSAGRRS